MSKRSEIISETFQCVEGTVLSPPRARLAVLPRTTDVVGSSTPRVCPECLAVDQRKRQAGGGGTDVAK